MSIKKVSLIAVLKRRRRTIQSEGMNMYGTLFLNKVAYNRKSYLKKSQA